MNEQIKLLLKKSGLQPYYNAQEGQIEKFAELIVQECIDYCGENLSKTVGGALKIHLGVEL
jgi:hypothetical protein